MTPSEDARASRPTRAQVLLFLVPVALSCLLVMPLVRWGGVSILQATGLPLAVAGALLAVWDTRWALCYAAFCITPFCVVQQEVLGVTINLPEALILALAVKEGARALLQRNVVPRALPVGPLAVFLMAAAVAIGTGFARGNGAIHVLQDFRQFVEFVTLFWLVLRCAGNREQAAQLATAYVLGASLIAIHGIIQHYTFIGISKTQIASDLVLHHGVRSGSFYGATTLGGLMILAVGPAIGVILAARRRPVQLLMLACIALCLVAAVFTKTRGSWIGLAVTFVLVGAAIRPGKRTLALAAAMALVFAAFLGPMVSQRIATLGDPEHDKSLMDRAQYYAAAYHIVRAHPILGLGWGCYYDIGEILTHEHYVKTPRPVEPPPENDPEAALDATVHSAYLQLFVKTGILGLLSFLALVVVWLERIGRGLKTGLRGDPAFGLHAGITAGVAGYLFHSTFENFFQWPVMAQSFWLLIGLSFLTAPVAAGHPRYARPVALIGAIAAVFAGFMYYCLQLETLHTDHYERNVAKALAGNDVEKALDIARRATEVELYEPMPNTVYARVLLLHGDTDAALEQLDKALGMAMNPPAPRRINTGGRYYFAPARLTLGQYYAERGDWLRALENFELARAYADLTGEEYAPFHALLYQAYALRGRWARALEFGEPSPAELDEVHPASLLMMARAYEGVGRWEDVARVAALLRGRGQDSADLRYFEGRAELALGNLDAAVASLAQVPAGAVGRAPYFLGRALEASGQAARALDAYRNTPPGNAYRIPALAHALALAKAQAERDALLNALREAIDSLRPVDQYGKGSEAAPLRPVSWFAAEGDAGAGGRFPVAVLWAGAGYNAADVNGASVLEDGENQILVRLEGTGGLVQLRWLENQAYWEGVERAYAIDSAIPGWVDAARDWFDLRPDRGVTVETADGNTWLNLNQLAWFYPAPVPLREGGAYLLAGRGRMPLGGGYFGWQLPGASANEVQSQRLIENEVLQDWTWRTGYQPDPGVSGSMRLLLESQRAGAGVGFDDIMVLPLEIPEWPLAP